MTITSTLRKDEMQGKGAQAICSFKSIPSAQRKRNGWQRDRERGTEFAQIASNLAYESARATEHHHPAWRTIRYQTSLYKYKHTHNCAYMYICIPKWYLYMYICSHIFNEL